ncbi:MAG: hypothetical protein ACO1RT_13210 [Planctomycetaceae bacterium]
MTQCIVVYDDDGAICAPYSLDEECEGAIALTDGPVALFPDREAARKAITISRRYAELLESQGKPFSDDFTTYRKNVKIRPVKPVESAQ